MTTETLTGSGSWEVPAGVTEITAKGLGAGGSGRKGSPMQCAWGPGGGAYAEAVLSVTPGDFLSYSVGQPVPTGTDRTGEDTALGTGLLLAKGGRMYGNTYAGTYGGQAAECIGDTCVSGGGGALNGTGQGGQAAVDLGAYSDGGQSTTASGTPTAGQPGTLIIEY